MALDTNSSAIFNAVVVLVLVFLLLFRLPKAMLCTYFELHTPHEEIKFEDDFETLNVKNEA